MTKLGPFVLDDAPLAIKELVWDYGEGEVIRARFALQSDDADVLGSFLKKNRQASQQKIEERLAADEVGKTINKSLRGKL